MKVSVVIPVYNCAGYLDRCLDSVCGQTLDDIEIVCVNDGSTDGSGEIIRGYAARDSRITIIDKPNGGLVSARKVGVSAAGGEYVGYVDGDDWIEPEMYERLYGLALENDSDMVSSGYILEGGYVSEEYDTIPEGRYDMDRRGEVLERLIFNMPERDLGIRGSLCCKLFRRNLLRDVQCWIPDEVTYSEDKLCVLTFALECGSIYVARKAWYHYVLNGESMTQKPNSDYLDKVSAVYRYLTELYSHPDFTMGMRAQAELYVTQLLIKGINSRMGFSARNLMWIDPGWMDGIPDGSSLLLYGGGGLAETYWAQVENSGRLSLAGMINDATDIPAYEFDYVVVTIKYQPEAERIKAGLVRAGIDEERILWFEQREVFWRYAEAMGLCK